GVGERVRVALYSRSDGCSRRAAQLPAWHPAENGNDRLPSTQTVPAKGAVASRTSQPSPRGLRPATALHRGSSCHPETKQAGVRVRLPVEPALRRQPEL